MDTVMTKSWRVWQRSIELAVLGFVMMVAALVGFLLGDYFVPPREPISLEVLTPAVPSEGALRYKVKFKRHKICKSEIQRFVLRIKDGVEMIEYRDQIAGSLWLESSAVVSTISTIKLPTLEPGSYQLRLFIVSACNLITRVDPYPTASFEVVTP